MKGYAKPLHEFIEGNKIQFVIPVYQRNYDWLIDNCDQLFGDLVKLSRSNRPSHFFGSIVTSSADNSYNRLVIDGQQRLTTISLLLLAGIKAVKDNAIIISDASRIEEAYELFLKAKFCNSERKIKLVPIENDRIAYDKIFKDEDSLDEGSKIELFQLPPVRFQLQESRTTATVFSYRKFADLDKSERVRACYQHACLKYVSNEKMNNQSLRARLGIEDKNYPMASRIIKDALEAKLIKEEISEGGSRHNYLPYWA